MKSQTVYICDECGSEWSAKVRARKCEASHKKYRRLATKQARQATEFYDHHHVREAECCGNCKHDSPAGCKKTNKVQTPHGYSIRALQPNDCRVCDLFKAEDRDG